jgi:hypothetical protein
MASVNGEYVGPLTTDDAPEIVGALLEGREVLPDKQLRKRPRAETLGMNEAPRSDPDPASGPTASGNDVAGQKDM